MSELHQAEYRPEIVRRLVDLLQRRRAPWQIADAANLPTPMAPYNAAGDSSRIFRGANALWLGARMVAQGWEDPRFVTEDQARAHGWKVRAGGGTDLQFWKLAETRERMDGDTGEITRERIPLDRPQSFIFRVYNASEIDGLPAFDRAMALPHQSEVLSALVRATELSVGAPLDVRNAAHSVALALAAKTWADHVDGADRSFRADLAAYLFARQAGIAFSPAGDARSLLPLSQGLNADPDAFFRATRDAQSLADQMLGLVRGQKAAVETAAESVKPRRSASAASNSIGTAQKAGAVSAAPGDRVFLAVPFRDIGKAKKLGARWDKELGVWWVDGKADRAVFAEWMLSDSALKAAGLDTADVLNEFADAMQSYGLARQTPVADGKWHNVPTLDAKGKEKKGAYILDMAGVPHGYIKNFRGQSGPWRYDGAKLSPEQRAALEAQAREKALVRDREVAEQQAAVAAQSNAVFETLPEAVNTHGYLSRKGVGAYGVRIAKAGEADLATLLNLPDFKGGNDTFLIVPGRDLDGNLLTVQAIGGKAGGAKLFVRDAKKKGAFHLIGSTGVKDLASAPAVLFAEGYATAASLHEATGLPVVVAFDAGNLVEVCKAISAVLPSSQPKIICGDNDQFFVENALERIAAIADRVDVPRKTVQVVAGNEGLLREVPLVGVSDDGKWHETRAGKYKLELESVKGVVQGVTADIVWRDTEKHVRLVLRNKGLESMADAARAINGKMVVPSFQSLVGKPTDFNDLSKSEGHARVASFVAPLLDFPLPKLAANVSVSTGASHRRAGGITR
ncbi:DUF5710 domain-containing protein [Trinickia mobilis]|uniref:DUF5710 domain-containing protein n=1 Tax=Trinickia mobilis TaxID=2816356 RepID=UPI001A8BF4FB|nr:DUF5710 domain-containing protein [Trinickia mobilis]